MWDVYRYHDEKMLCTAMWVVLLAYVVFGHPRYHNRKGTTVSSGLIWQIRSAFMFGVLAYMVPLGICAAAMFQGKIVFSDTSLRDLEPNNVIEIDENSMVRQEIIADGTELSNIKIRVWNGEQSISDQISVKIIEKDTGVTNVYISKIVRGIVYPKEFNIYLLEIKKKLDNQQPNL